MDSIKRSKSINDNRYYNISDLYNTNSLDFLIYFFSISLIFLLADNEDLWLFHANICMAVPPIL
jgi:hypothetical protein